MSFPGRVYAYYDTLLKPFHRLMLHFPMHAFINLFIYVIGNPELPSANSDLALLDVAAGYFGQMEFVTGARLSFPFARDIAAFARTMVEEAQVATPRVPTENPDVAQAVSSRTCRLI